MKLVAVDYQADNADQLFVESLRETGFGVLKNHPIQQAMVSSIYANWQSFFDGEDKHNYMYDKETQDGFFPTSVSETAKGFKKKDIKEYYHYYPWGKCPDALKEEISNYYNSAISLAKELLGWVEQYSPDNVSSGYSQALV